MIIKCGDCKGKVSLSAKSCPNCGNTEFKEQYILENEHKPTKKRFNFQFSKKQILNTLWLLIYTLAGVRFVITQHFICAKPYISRLYKNDFGLLIIHIMTLIILIAGMYNTSNKLAKRKLESQYESLIFILFGVSFLYLISLLINHFL